MFHPLSEDYEKVTRESIENIYSTFVGHVADGRDMTREEVDAIGQGRVWSGTEALEIGLVDEIGGLEDAVAYAAETGGTTDYTIQDFPVYTTSVQDIMDKFIGVSIGKTKEEILKEEIGEQAYRVLQNIKVLSAQKGAQARMPFELIIR